MLVPSLSWPGETVVGLALHGVFGASLSFGPCTPSQAGLLHIQGAEPFWRCLHTGRQGMESDWDARTQ